MVKSYLLMVTRTLISLIFIIGFHFDSFSQTVGEFIAEALEVAESGEHDQSLAIYDAAIKMYPNDPILYVLKGELLTKFNKRLTADEGAYEKALMQFNLALKLDSTFLPAYSSRAQLNLVHQKYELAIKDFTEAIRLAQDDDDKFGALSDRANAKLYAKDYRGAIEDYSQALKIRPTEIGIQLNLGVLFVNLNQVNDAEEKFTKVLRIDPQNIDALNNLSALYIAQQKTTKAISILEEAIQIYPDEPDLYNNLGLARIKTGQPEEAIILINKSLSLYSDDSYAYKHRAMAYIELGKLTEACEDLFKANQLGYSISFDNEVNELINKNCKK